MHCANCAFIVPVLIHIYNALKKLQYLDESWKLMDQIIEANISPLFHGNLPDTREIIRKRFLLLVGVPVSHLGRIGDDFKFDFSKKEIFSLPEISEPTAEYLSNVDWELSLEMKFLHTSQCLWKNSHINRKEGTTKLDICYDISKRTCQSWSAFRSWITLACIIPATVYWKQSQSACIAQMHGLLTRIP